MDEIDVKILRVLGENGRCTVSEIGARINMSVPAVSERLRKLESSGIIEQYTVILNSVKLKKDLTAFMLIGIERSKAFNDFLKVVEEIGDVLECHYIAGDYDYMLKIVTENTTTLESLLNKIKSIRGVQKTKTVLVLSTKKNKPSALP